MGRTDARRMSNGNTQDLLKTVAWISMRVSSSMSRAFDRWVIRGLQIRFRSVNHIFSAHSIREALKVTEYVGSFNLLFFMIFDL